MLNHAPGPCSTFSTSVEAWWLLPLPSTCCRLWAPGWHSETRNHLQQWLVGTLFNVIDRSIPFCTSDTHWIYYHLFKVMFYFAIGHFFFVPGSLSKSRYMYRVNTGIFRCMSTSTYEYLSLHRYTWIASIDTKQMTCKLKHERGVERETSKLQFLTQTMYVERLTHTHIYIYVYGHIHVSIWPIYLFVCLSIAVYTYVRICLYIYIIISTHISSWCWQIQCIWNGNIALVRSRALWSRIARKLKAQCCRQSISILALYVFGIRFVWNQSPCFNPSPNSIWWEASEAVRWLLLRSPWA